MNQIIRLLFLFFICCIPGGHLMAQTWDWAVQFGNEGNEMISGFEINNAGNYFLKIRNETFEKNAMFTKL